MQSLIPRWEPVYCSGPELRWLFGGHTGQIRFKLGSACVCVCVCVSCCRASCSDYSKSPLSVLSLSFFTIPCDWPCVTSASTHSFSFRSPCFSLVSLPGWNYGCEARRKGLCCRPECSLPVSACVFLSLVRCTQRPAGSPGQTIQLESGREGGKKRQA